MSQIYLSKNEISYMGVVSLALSIQTNCSLDWKLNVLDKIIDSMEDEIELAITQKQILTDRNYANIILRIAGKSVVNMREIICLSTYGYPDGALSIARNLYEQVIILAFFENHKNDKDFNNYIEDYYTDYDIQRNKALQYKAENCLQDSQTQSALKAELKQLKKAAHHSVFGDYWWSGNSKFAQLVKIAIASVPEEKGQKFLHELHLVYKRACMSIHSNCIGNTLRLGINPDFVGIDTSPTTKGHSLPLWFATTSFDYIMGVTYTLLGLDYQKNCQDLNNLVLFFREREFQS